MYTINRAGAPARALCAACKAGTIHSVFAKVINVSLDNGELISLYRAELAPAPAALITDISPSCPLDRLPVARGDAVAIGENNIVLAGKIVFAGWHTSELWHSSFEGGALPDPRTRPQVMESIRLLNDCLKAKQELGGLQPLASVFDALLAGNPHPHHFGDPFLDCACQGIQNLLRAIRTSDQAGITAWSGTLLGLGPGLTPSGDDFLSGMMAALHLIFKAYRLPPEAPLAISRSMIRHMGGRTNAISRHFLQYASIGSFGQTSEQVLFHVLFRQEERLWIDAAEALLQHGATSGVDQLLGMLYGAAAALEMTAPAGNDAYM